LFASTTLGASLAPTTILKAPYKGTLGSPNFLAYANGCSRAQTSTMTWAASTGHLQGLSSTRASTCRTLGYVGGGGLAYSSTGITVAIPFRVASNGNHSIASSWNMTLGTVQAMTTANCPAKKINYNPPVNGNTYSYCTTSTNIYFSVTAGLEDLNNNSWTSYNYSFGTSYNDSSWQNYTHCYNYGTPACTNTTGLNSYATTYGFEDPGFNAFVWNGATRFTLWTNATGMVAKHHFALLISIDVNVGSYAQAVSLSVPWAGIAKASISLAAPNNGASLSSISIG
jgi:hypothetical protein